MKREENVSEPMSEGVSMQWGGCGGGGEDGEGGLTIHNTRLPKP